MSHVRLCQAIQLPSSHPNSLHPALSNAVFLAACAFAGPIFASYEDLFLKRANEGLSDSLAFADRLEDMIWASNIIAWYHVKYGRIIVAYSMAASAFFNAFSFCHLLIVKQLLVVSPSAVVFTPSRTLQAI